MRASGERGAQGAMHLTDEECRAVKYAVMRELASGGAEDERHAPLRRVLGKLAERLRRG
jgi:hypothetical protein